MKKKFVAINFINCQPDYVERFEQLFATRAHAIDQMPGFIDMYVLRPSTPEESYLIVSNWESEESFKNWTTSPAFIEGHKRGFEDVRRAKEEGKTPPMTSSFKVYEVISN
jgi:heme-degrading monooxygenase HmoA